MERGGPPPSPAAETAPPGPTGAFEEGEGISEEDMARLAAELTSTPVEDVVANHCYGLFELAALHLSQQPPNLASARLAIDAMGVLVDGLGERLGQHHGTLTEGLTQLRLAFVKISEASSTPGQSGGA